MSRSSSQFADISFFFLFDIPTAVARFFVTGGGGDIVMSAKGTSLLGGGGGSGGILPKKALKFEALKCFSSTFYEIMSLKY